MQGIITIKAVNIQTSEVENEFECKNIIGDGFIRNFTVEGGNLQLNVRLSTAIYKPTLYPYTVHTNDSNGFESLVRSGDVFGVPAWSFIDETQSTPAILQYSARFAPPSTVSRTIKSVMLESSSGKLLTLTELATPCIQTTSQYYDIYYRIIFDYTDVPNGIPWVIYKSMIKNLLVNNFYSNTLGYFDSYSCFPILNINSSEDIVRVTTRSHPNTTSCYTETIIPNINLPVINKRNYSLKHADGSVNLGFNQRSGCIFNSIGTREERVQNFTHFSDVYRNRSKIQNIFGYAFESSNTNSDYFLDIDALANGSGSIQLTGDWENEEITNNPNLYFRKDFAKRISLEITTGGPVGSASYKYSVQPFIKVSNGVDYVSGYNLIPKNKQVPELITGLLSDTDYAVVHNNKGVMGVVSPDIYGPEQISAAKPYDASSVLLPKKNEIILYSIPGSRYWRITGSFTNIHQIAVRNDVVFIACRDTGLWTVNPRVSLTAQQVTVTGYRNANFSSCNGVAIGYDNKIWAVGLDALASFDGTSWTLYDSTTTNPFIPVDYTYINYLVVDFESSADQMLCVYKTESSTKLGFWWSVDTTVVETSNYVTSYYQDCKRNKGQIYGLQGHWLYNHVSYMTFGQTTSPVNKTNYPSSSDKSISTYNFVKNNGVWYRFTVENNEGYNLINLDGTINTVIRGNNGYGYPVMSILRSIDNSSGSYATLRSNIVSDSSNYDCQMSFMLSDGVLFTMFIAHLNIDKYSFRAGVITAGLNNTPHGGASRWICTKNYGWNGTNWELDHSGSKLTSSTPEPLAYGINIAFTNGVSGTSFISGNYYKFGLAEGVLKDNATRLSIKVPTFFTRTETGVPVLTSNTVPALSNLPTGIVSAHSVFKSKDVYLDGSNRVTFPGNNVGQFAVGDKQVTGDFELTVSCADMSNILNRFTFVGVGKHKRGDRPLIYLLFSTSSTVNICTSDVLHYSIRDSSNKNGAVAGISSFSVSSSDNVGIKRIGTTIFITKNGNTVYTIVVSAIRQADSRLDVMFGLGYDGTNDHVVSDKFCGVTTIVSNGSDNAIKLGNELQGTESFDMNCKEVVIDTAISGKLNNNTVPVIISGALPSPGEISLDTDSLTLTFHPTDEGKTVEINCTRVWNK